MHSALEELKIRADLILTRAQNGDLQCWSHERTWRHTGMPELLNRCRGPRTGKKTTN